MPETKRFDLRPDTRGAVWDLLLYVPTVAALASFGAKLWFGGDQTLAYLLSFLASFFFLVGANRILKTRLMLLPSAPVAIEFGDDVVSVALRGTARVDLVKEQKIFPDMAGTSFGVSGLDGTGKRIQFIFHRAQFAQEGGFRAAQDAFTRLLKRQHKSAG